jgi:hypothetical protein
MAKQLEQALPAGRQAPSGSNFPFPYWEGLGMGDEFLDMIIIMELRVLFLPGGIMYKLFQSIIHS